MDLRSPFVLDTRQMGRGPGTTKAYEFSAPAPEGLKTDMVGVPEGASLELTVRLESVAEGVLVTGTVTGPVNGECGRCLDVFTDAMVADLVDLFAYPGSSTEETTGADEVPRIENEHIDLEPMVRDAVVLALPVTPLCRPDCAGLCPDCGERLDDLPDDHTHTQIDPRWSALAERFAETDPSQTRSHPTGSQSQE